ncbi:MAG: hypothetical protein JST68_06055 [Bacteroidetes bacterium]|nr:hypothetical protein [Bacteroidota bacterium]
MSQAYPYIRQNAYQYKFVSYGKERIEKSAIFISAPGVDVFAFTFGDTLSDGSLDTDKNSNNGDMFKVLRTIINILNQFLEEHPYATIFFIGSAPNRTLYYQRFLKNNYSTLSKKFIISAIIQVKNRLSEVPFDPSSTTEYRGFYIKILN